MIKNSQNNLYDWKYVLIKMNYCKTIESNQLIIFIGCSHIRTSHNRKKLFSSIKLNILHLNWIQSSSFQMIFDYGKLYLNNWTDFFPSKKTVFLINGHLLLIAFSNWILKLKVISILFESIISTEWLDHFHIVSLTMIQSTSERSLLCFI